MARLQNIDLEAVKGDDVSFYFELIDVSPLTGIPDYSVVPAGMSYSGSKVTDIDSSFVLVAKYDHEETSPTIEIDADVVTGEDGTILRIHLTATDTEDIPVYQRSGTRLVYDLRMLDEGSVKRTLARGIFRILPCGG